MNYALIFAGGVGKRMKQHSIPKQFLKVKNKPIIIYTIEHFQNNKNINKIVVVCVASHIEHMKKLKNKYNLCKVVSVVPGGDCGQKSIFNGLIELKKFAKPNDIILIHDGVRPLINSDLIDRNINDCKKFGSSITIAPVKETIMFSKDNNVDNVFDRSRCFIGRAPQCFKFKDIYGCHTKAKKINKYDFVDSSDIMKYFGHNIHITDGPDYNIKISDEIDFQVFKVLIKDYVHEK